MIRPKKSINRRTTYSANRTRQRGSALLIVIGTLALVAVFAAVYVSIGRTDRRAAQSFRSRVEQRDNARQISEYLAGVVGGDRLDTHIRYNSSGDPIGRREVIDLPYTDWTRRSEVNLASADERARLFTSVGGPAEAGSLDPLSDYRVQSDPWLASTTPVFLGNPGDPFVFNERPFSRIYPYDPTSPNAWNYLDQRDWLQISNFAPDGRPVNLFNLRPNRSPFAVDDVATSDFGGFDAEPGFGVTRRDSDGRRIRRMSNFLSLLNVVPGADDEQPYLRAFDPAVEGVWVPGYNQPQSIGLSDDEIRNTPAVWTMYQRYMFMPMNQPFITYDRGGTEETSWASPDYPPYQYADADADGFADSRWFELRAASDLSAGNSIEPRDDIRELIDAEDMRLFIAARAVDLSSMVNVNTATDGLLTPDLEYPMGSSPAEIDLRRLLTMQDQAEDHVAESRVNSGAVIPLSLNAGPRPYAATENLAQVWMWDAPDRAGINFQRDPQDYQFYQATVQSYDLRLPDSDSPSMLIGRYAYAALRRGLTAGGTPSDEFRGFDMQSGLSATDSADLVQYEADPYETMIGEPTDLEERWEGYERIGRQYAANSGYSTYFGDLYGLDDLSELLTYHGLNDPDFTSRLERVMDGRYDSSPTGRGAPVGNADPLRTRRMSPLLSNRDLTLDRFGHTRILDAADMRVAPGLENIAIDDRLGEVSRNSMALMALTPRKRMTTLSGFVPLSPDEVIADIAEPQAITPGSVLPNLSEVAGSPSALFGLYANALAGEAADIAQPTAQTWETDPTLADVQPYSTLFYGYRGPELAMRIAAHAALNYKDLADADTDPTVATITFTDNDSDGLVEYAREVSNQDTVDLSDPNYRLFPGAVAGNLLTPAIDRQLTPNLPSRREAVNVYGLEASPVITEVSMLYAFTDAPDGFEATKDYSDDLPLIRNVGRRRIVYPAMPPESVRIDTTVENTNPDYLMQVLAIQLHNPYGEAISLGGSGIGSNAPLTRKPDEEDIGRYDNRANFQFDYYLEYQGRFFKVARYIDWYPADPDLLPPTADSPIVESFYATDRSIADERGIPANRNPAEQIGGSTGGAMPIDAYPDFITRNVILQPGETRVFYALADQRFDDVRTDTTSGPLPPDQRWEDYLTAWGDLPRAFTQDRDGDGLPDGRDRRGWTGPAEEWVNHQLTVYAPGDVKTPVLMMPFDPRTGELFDRPDGFETLNTAPVASTLPLDAARINDNEVRLWKKIATRGEEESGNRLTAGATRENLMENDMLVDRMRVSDMSSTWGSSGEVEIAGTWSYEEGLPEAGTEYFELGLRNDNTGITVADWVTTRRADNDSQEEPDAGEVTPWILRSSVNNGISTRTGDRFESFNATDPANPESYFENFDAISEPRTVPRFLEDYEITATLGEMFDYASANGANAIIQTIALPPYAKSDVVAPFGAGAVIQENDGPNNSAGKFPPFQLAVSGTGLDPSDGAKPLLHAPSQSAFERSRLTDLLLPWGIGGVYAPDPTRGTPANLVYLPEEWLTPPEAMAIAMGLEVDLLAPAGPNTPEPFAVWQETWDLTAPLGERGILEDGRLSLDRFMPFINADPAEDPVEFTPGVDLARGAGVPAALGVLDRARVFAPLDRATDRVTSAPDPTRPLTRPVFGTININTAPVEVLRLLPGLTPTRARYVASPVGATLEYEWWGNRLPESEAADTTMGAESGIDLLVKQPDVAAGLVAYRDRITATPITGAHPSTSGWRYFVAPLNVGVNDNPVNLEAFANNLVTEDPNLAGSVATLDRRRMTGIDGLRLTPGFASLGEVLSVRLDPELETTDRPVWEKNRGLTMGLYGSDGIAQQVQDGATVLPQVYREDGEFVGGDTIDDYAEKLAVASGVANMISVRSDFYAVWFIVQGYRESDVANLRPEDPLIPTLQKRYMMVIDRSNVIEPGDQPKILLFKEVPL